MDLAEDPKEYAEIVRSSTLSYTALIGIVVAIILAIAGLVAFTVLRGGLLLPSILDTLTYIFTPLLILDAVFSYYKARKSWREALEFHEMARRIAEAIGASHGEILEKPAPPFIVIYRRRRRYIVVRKEDGTAVVNVMEPVKISHERTYSPVYIWKTNEILMYKDIDGIRTAWIKIWAVFPDPADKEIVYGEFNTYSARILASEEKIKETALKLIKAQTGEEE